MIKVSVTLAGRTYELEPMTFKKSKEWRGKLKSELNQITSLVDTVSHFEINRVEDLTVILQQGSGILLDSVDKIFDMIIEFSPDLKHDREYLEENAYDDEILTVFWECVKLAFPFGSKIKDLTGLLNQAIATSSAEPSGDSKKSSKKTTSRS